MLLIGYDIGSSSIKASLLNAQTGKVLALATSPKTEMEISAPHPGWAEQQPQVWWQHIKITTAEIKSQVKFDPKDVRAIGLSYQMHGLVVVDKNRNVLRPSIIWCDSRAVPIGEKALAKIKEWDYKNGEGVKIPLGVFYKIEKPSYNELVLKGLNASKRNKQIKSKEILKAI